MAATKFEKMKPLFKFFPDAHQSDVNDEQSLLQELGTHGVYGRYKEAKLIWEANPELLNRYIKITSPRGYKYNNTLFQIALKNEEYEYAEDMAKSMSEDERVRQFAEVFPDGEIKSYLNSELATKLIHAAYEKIINDPCINTEVGTSQDSIETKLDVMSDDTREAIKKLHELFESQLKLASQPGLVSDPNIWVRVARKLYNDGNWNQVKPIFSLENRLFYLIQIDEYLAGLQGTAYLNLHAQGVMYNNFGRVLQSGCMIRPDKNSDDTISYFEAFSWPSIPPYYVSAAGALTTRPDVSGGLLSARVFYAHEFNDYNIEKRRERAMMLGKKQEPVEERDPTRLGFN